MTPDSLQQESKETLDIYTILCEGTKYQRRWFDKLNWRTGGCGLVDDSEDGCRNLIVHTLEFNMEFVTFLIYFNFNITCKLCRS